MLMSNHRTNLENVISQVISYDNQITKKQYDRYQRSKKLIQSIELNAIDDLLILYCNKTGQPFDEISPEHFQKMAHIAGKDKALELIRSESIYHTAYHWKWCGPEELKKLAETDPVGYSVYATSIVLRSLNALPDYNLMEKKSKDKYYADLEHRKQAWRTAQEIPISLILMLNEMLRRYLAIIKTSKTGGICKFISTVVSEALASPTSCETFIDELKKNITAIIEHEYKKGRIKKNITYADIVELKLTYEGYTPFRRQRRPQAQDSLEDIIEELSEFIPTNDPSFTLNASIQSLTLSEKTQQHKKEKKQQQQTYAEKLKQKKPFTALANRTKKGV